MERNFLKGIISTLMAKGYNYVRCLHEPMAPAMCEAARKYSTPSDQWDKDMVTISLSRFCPRPDTDPTLICQAEHWYFANQDQHVVPMNSLQSFGSFQRDRFKFTIDEMFREAYDEYEKCGNDCQKVDWTKGPFSRDMSWAGKFSLPICKSDQTHIVDITKTKGWRARDGSFKHWFGWLDGEWTQNTFPSTCGDFRSNETASFLEAMNSGPKSDAYNNPEMEMLWQDRIPRVGFTFVWKNSLMFDRSFNR